MTWKPKTSVSYGDLNLTSDISLCLCEIEVRIFVVLYMYLKFCLLGTAKTFEETTPRKEINFW